MSSLPPQRDAGLLVLSEEPLNAETVLLGQTGVITSTSRFYIRSHFPIPTATQARLVVEGAVASPLALSLDALRALPPRSLVVTLECAGNGRAFLEPRVPGEQWGVGAVSTAEWTGVSLGDVLERARPRAKAVEVLFRGADEGTPKDLGEQVPFERSLPLAKASNPDTLLAYAMNGEPLPPEHGAPLRLVVPGWYGMASVKWLQRITVLERPFRGFYQRDRYVVGSRPLTTIEPRAVVAWPQEGDVIGRGRHLVRGYAWSGAAPPPSVEVSVDGGASWDRAEIAADAGPYAWREWRYAWEAREVGRATLLARTRDAAGNAQPLSQRWNPLGYANNAVRPVRVTVG